MNDEHDNAVTDRDMLERTNALSMSMLREWWGDRRDASTHSPSRHSQDADNHANLYFHDSVRILSFHWQGDVTRPIEVSFGGDHEPPSWVFRFQDYRPRRVIAGTSTLVQAFEKTCKNWIKSMEEGLR